jgi:hypothetical protein
MPATNTPLTGDALLVAVTDAMVALHERYHLAPATAKTLLLDGDLLACVLGRCLHRRREDDDRTATHQDRPGNPQRLPHRDATQIHRRRRTPIRPGRPRVLKTPRRPRYGGELFMLKPNHDETVNASPPST